jgi:hypothetical protein
MPSPSSWPKRQDIARRAAEAVELDYEELPATSFADKALADGAPQVHENVPGNLIFNWEIGDEAKTEAAMSGAAHVTTLDITNNRLSPNAMEPRSAPSPSTTRPRITTRSTPPARTPMWRGWSSRLLPGRARAQAARDRAGRGRWLRVEDLHLPRGDHLPLGVDEDGPLGEMDLGPV